MYSAYINRQIDQRVHWIGDSEILEKYSLLDVYEKPKVIYTVLQKKCTLILSSSPGDPGSLTPTPGHVN